jgi:hypothetical protein
MEQVTRNLLAMMAKKEIRRRRHWAATCNMPAAWPVRPPHEVISDELVYRGDKGNDNDDADDSGNK